MKTNRDNLICYCFNYTIADIEQDVLANGRSTIVDRIISAKRDGKCECAAKNPNGT